MFWCLFFCFKQKTAYEMRISDWSSDVCSSDLRFLLLDRHRFSRQRRLIDEQPACLQQSQVGRNTVASLQHDDVAGYKIGDCDRSPGAVAQHCRMRGDHVADRAERALGFAFRSEEHTSELQSLMRISYAVFCLK